jgi:hypothetical protein
MAAHKRISRIGSILVAMVVAGCAAPIAGTPFAQCDAVPPDVFEAVDWEAARRINVRIRHGEFDPSLIRLYLGRPYVMQIENRDRTSRRLQALGFFEAIYIHSLIRRDGTQAVSCPWGIRVAPGEVAEVRFIAARDGRYEYGDDLLPVIFGGIPEGIVHIEQPPAIAALLPLVIPGITRPPAIDDIPTGPYAPASVPLAPPAPETPSPAEPAVAPVVPPAPEAPAGAEPAAMPVLPPKLEVPSPAEPAVMPILPPELEVPSPAEPIVAPVVLSLPETPSPAEPTVAPIAPPPPEAVPVAPVTLPVPLPIPEVPSPAGSVVAPVLPPMPETPAPAEPIVAPVVPPMPETPAPAEPAAPPVAPPSPLPEMPPAATVLVPAPTAPGTPRTLLPEHAPGRLPPPQPGGVGLFGQ